MSATFDGAYFDGRTPVPHPATVTVTAEGLHLTLEDGSSDRWRYGEIDRVVGGRHGIPVRFERADPAETVTVDDATILDEIDATAPTGMVRFSTPVRRRRRVLLTIALTVGGLGMVIGAYLWGVPALADSTAARIPPAWERQLGAAAMATLAPTQKTCTDAQVQSAVERIVGRLAEHAPVAYEWELQVIQDDMVNAFAAPGGFIVVHTGLLEKTGRPEELAGVLAHEMQHVLRQHGTKALLRRVPFRLFLSMLTGDVSLFGGAIEAIGLVGMLRYQRQDELEADREGLTLLRDAAVDPTGMSDVFAILRDEAFNLPEGLTYLSTHPNTDARIATIDSLIVAGPATEPVPLLPDADWGTLRTACR